jgi:hypothetical protein
MLRLSTFCAAVVAPVALGLAAPADAAFNVVQAKGAAYKPVAGPIACGAGKCTTKLDPAKVVDLGAQNADNTKTLKTDLGAQKADYKLTGFGPSLDIDFVITDHRAINDGSIGGGQLIVDYVGQKDFKPPENLHWLQIVTDDYNITGINGTDLKADKGIGKPEDVIDAIGVPTPYYEDFATLLGFGSKPPHFEDFSKRPEPTKDNPSITWSAILYLVSDDGKKNITVHNAVKWGWVTTFSAAPEPASWAMMILGFGGIGAMMRHRRRLGLLA